MVRSAAAVAAALIAAVLARAAATKSACAASAIAFLAANAAAAVFAAVRASAAAALSRSEIFFAASYAARSEANSPAVTNNGVVLLGIFRLLCGKKSVSNSCFLIATDCELICESAILRDEDPKATL